MSGRGPLILDNARHGLVGLGSSDEDPYSVAGSGSREIGLDCDADAPITQT